MIPAPDTTIVTGAAGWLGTGLVHALAEGEWQREGRIRALVLAGDDTSGLPESVDVVRGDITTPDGLTDLFDRLDGTVDVIHAAGVVHPTSVADFDVVNHVGTRNVMEHCRQAGVRRVVHVSSNSPFGTNGARNDIFRNDEPYNPYLGYGLSKQAAELALLDEVERGLDAVIVRPPWFYGPHQPARQTTFFTMVRTGRFPVLGDGGQRRSMTYIGNLVQGIVRAELTPTDPGRAWWIADAEPYTVRQIVDTVGRALAAEGYDVVPNRVRLPDLAGSVAEKIDRLLQARGLYNQQFHVLGEMNKTIAVDISAARRDLGYDPSVSLFDGMRTSIRWCRDAGIEL